MPENDNEPVSFDEWSMVLEGESFDAATRERYRRWIVAYLDYLKERDERPSVASAKAYIESGETKGVTDTLARDALRWFFLAARRRDPAAGGDSKVEEQASPIHPEQTDLGKPPFNEISVLFPLLTLYTVGYLGLMLAEFILRGGLTLPAGLMPVYIALTAAYAADKEIRRWAGTPEPPRKGSFFVYLWLLFYLVAFLIRVFRPEYAMPEELAKVALQVLGIFFGSRASKYVWEGRSQPEDPEAVNRRELQIMDMIKTQGRIKNSDVARHFGISDTSARRVLSSMVDKGLIRRVGERKATYYEAVGDK